MTQDIKHITKVLVSSADEAKHSSLREHLNQREFQLTSASSVKEAVQIADQNSQDIIILFDNLVDPKAIKSIQGLREQIQYQQTPILMIGTCINDDEIDKAFSYGITEYFSEPVNYTNLSNRIRIISKSIANRGVADICYLMLQNTTHGMIITNKNLEIVALNSAFSTVTGYSEKEALGNTPRLLQSGKHDKTFYQTMWATINNRGQWEGEIWNRRKNGEVYPEWLSISEVKNSAGQVTNYIGAFSDISVFKDREKRLQQLAHFDSLTGLANRLLFHERLDQAISQAKRNQNKVALLYIDLDNFKPINDKYGHDAGDTVLKIAAQRLKQTIRDVDTAARLGGDEFGIILHDINKIEDAINVLTKLLKNVAKAISVNEQDIIVGCSIGISVYPDHASNSDELIKLADDAMYYAKKTGKNQFCFSDVENALY